MRIASLIFACALALMASSAHAQTINASLNVSYTDTNNLALGGTWEVVVKTSAEWGLSGVNLRLANIDAAVTNESPRGNVNGTDPAGFSIFELLVGARLIAQEPLFHAQEGMFYGVGFLANGHPGDIGPAFPTPPTNLFGSPWGTGDTFKNDPFWDNAARFISGTFSSATAPAWLTGGAGNVFLDQGTSSAPGPISPSISLVPGVNAIVRTNLASPTESFDYNNNGVVDAADYVLWRHGSPEADGNGDTFVNEIDYDLWVQHFGEVVGGGSSADSGNPVPEPASLLLLVFGTAMIVFFGGKRARMGSPAAPARVPAWRDRFLRE